jgi:hypothetical protein
MVPSSRSHSQIVGLVGLVGPGELTVQGFTKIGPMGLMGPIGGGAIPELPRRITAPSGGAGVRRSRLKAVTHMERTNHAESHDVSPHGAHACFTG